MRVSNIFFCPVHELHLFWVEEPGLDLAHIHGGRKDRDEGRDEHERPYNQLCDEGGLMKGLCILAQQ